MEVLPETLHHFKNLGIALYNFNPDHPFVYSGYGSGNDNVKHSFELFDCHFIYSLNLLAECRSRFKRKFFHLPFAYDLDFPGIEEVYQQVEESNSLCFIGNPDKDRASLVMAIAKCDVEIDLFGTNWEKFISKNDRIRTHQPVYGLALWKTFRRYRMQLNMLRKHNMDAHNQRTYELTGVGAIQIAPTTTDHKVLFVENEEIFLYNTPEECAEKVNVLSSLTSAKAIELSNNILAKNVSAKRSYEDRASYVFECFKQ
jgi:spore maturation protein CgeB